MIYLKSFTGKYGGYQLDENNNFLKIENEVKEEISQEEGIEVSVNVSKDTLTDVELKTENSTILSLEDYNKIYNRLHL